jgi:ABC transport system ATP-binding/permease protein
MPGSMNEITLNALINLFALFSAVSESGKGEAVKNFSMYLRQHFGIFKNDEYLRLFEELLDLYGVGGEPDLPIDMIEQAARISMNIRSRLPKDEQIMVFLRFLEFSKSGNISKAEKLFEVLADVFEIDKTEREKFLAFTFHTSIDQVNFSDFLVIDNRNPTDKHAYKHIYEKGLSAELLFLRSSLIGHFIFVFQGKEDLTIEGNPVMAGRFYAFREGSIIRGARISPIYFTDIASYFTDVEKSPPFIFSGEEIEFKYKNSNNGIHRFSFKEKSGQLIAIMGGSGAGKSTLLNLLNGNIPLMSGRIKINHTDIGDQKKDMEGLIGYVPQDDLLFEDLTVKENLYFNARLCFSDLSPSEIDVKVERILQELELSLFKDMQVGSPLKKLISGGQRKRLNIALELIREPVLLFVDEPTSGLSSTDSEKVMLLMKQQARKGRLIIVNIHQPSSAIFKLFDKLWILDSGGRPIYSGNPLDAILYFKTEVDHVNADVCECFNCGNVNPEQVLEIVECRKIDNSGNFLAERRFSPEYWYKRYRDEMMKKDESHQTTPTTLPGSGSKKPGLLKQFRIFFERNLKIKITDRQYLIINILEAPLLAVIVGYFTRFSEGDNYIFFENKSLISYLFMSIVVVLFMGMSVSAEEIIRDRKILQRESFLNLSRFSYLNSKVLFLILLSAFQTFSFVVIGNLILEIPGMTFTYWIVLFSVAVFSNLLGLNISSALDSVVTIYIVIPLILIPQILLCGVIVKFDDLQGKTACRDATPVAGEIMVSRWAFEALAVEQFKGNGYMAYFFDLEKEMAQAVFRSDILTTELTGQADLINGWIRQNKPAADISRKLLIIRNEIGKLDAETSLPRFRHYNDLVIDKYNYETAELVKSHLTGLKDFYAGRARKIRAERERLISRFNEEKGHEYLYDLKMKSHNKSLEKLVLNADIKEFFHETPCGIMQKIAPVYKDPDFSNGRAHFLASGKNLFGITLETHRFNLMVIWLMTGFLYLALYYDWLRRIISIPLHLFYLIPKVRATSPKFI